MKVNPIETYILSHRCDSLAHQLSESSLGGQRRRPADAHQGGGISNQRSGQPLVDVFSAGGAKQEFEQRCGERKNVWPVPEPMAQGSDHFRDRQRLRIGDNERSPQRPRCCEHRFDRRQQIFHRKQRAARPETAKWQGKGRASEPHQLRHVASDATPVDERRS
jgi:hypothetical protein